MTEHAPATSRAKRLDALLEQLRREVTDADRAAMQRVEDSLFDVGVRGGPERRLG